MAPRSPHDRRRSSTAADTTSRGSGIVIRMLGCSAARSVPRSLHRAADTVASDRELHARGFSTGAIQAQVRARRWRRFGRAVVLHNGALRRVEAQRASLINCGPRAVLTSFTAAEAHGLSRWEREPTHVLVPGGTKIRRVAQLSVVVHYSSAWSAVRGTGGLHDVADALVIAASSFRSARSGCGILAAAVQQRIVRPDDLVAALAAASRTRHRATFLDVVNDIAQGSEALSEIDFARLCRRHGLPEPRRQSRRRDSAGRTRYLDAEWIRRDGRRVVAEVDGALHLLVRNWWDDQVRQNEVTLGDSLVLRFPSAVLRTEEQLVARQLRRALLI